MRVGVLALQGAFIEHEHVLEKLGCTCVELRKKSDICSLDGLILPGGESTVQGKLLKELDMFEPIKDIIAADTPVLATCAGLILLSANLSNDENAYFKTMPVTVKRNAYGRQLGSFHYVGDFGKMKDIPMTFIRAPYIESAASEVTVLSTVNNNIVGAKYRNQIGISFHPELDNDTRIHEYFLNL